MTAVPDFDPDALAATVHAAIATHLAGHGGGMVDGFALAVEYVDHEGGHSWSHLTLAGQPASRTLGMLRFHTIDVEAQVVGYLTSEAGP